MKVTRFTTNIGNYDKATENVLCLDYDLFRNNARNSRAVKILAHRFIDCDISIYIDANKRFTDFQDSDIDKILGDADMLVAPSNKSVYEEITAALRRVDNQQEKEILKAQGEHYRKIGVPDSLIVCGYQPLVRRHNERTNRFFEAWWAEMCRWSYRDQVSFPVVAHLSDIKIKKYDLTKLGYKLYSHGNKSNPIVL
jgi:hypothetical protein